MQHACPTRGLSRRRFLMLSTAGAGMGGGLLAACAPAAPAPNGGAQGRRADPGGQRRRPDGRRDRRAGREADRPSPGPRGQADCGPGRQGGADAAGDRRRPRAADARPAVLRGRRAAELPEQLDGEAAQLRRRHGPPSRDRRVVPAPAGQADLALQAAAEPEVLERRAARRRGGQVHLRPHDGPGAPQAGAEQPVPGPDQPGRDEGCRQVLPST